MKWKVFVKRKIGHFFLRFNVRFTSLVVWYSPALFTLSVVCIDKTKREVQCSRRSSDNISHSIRPTTLCLHFEDGKEEERKNDFNSSFEEEWKIFKKWNEEKKMVCKYLIITCKYLLDKLQTNYICSRWKVLKSGHFLKARRQTSESVRSFAFQSVFIFRTRNKMPRARFDNISFSLAIKQWGSVCLCIKQRHCVCQQRVLNNSKSGVNKVSRELNVLFKAEIFLELPFSHWRAIRKFDVLYNRHELKPIFREKLSISRLLLQIIRPGVMVFLQHCNQEQKYTRKLFI